MHNKNEQGYAFEVMREKTEEKKRVLYRVIQEKTCTKKICKAKKIRRGWDSNPRVQSTMD